MRSDHDFTAIAGAAFAEAEHGDFRGFEPVWADVCHARDPASRACRLALEAIRWVFEPTFCAVPDTSEARKILKDLPSTGPLVARACAVMERAYAVALDRERLAVWVEIHDSIPTANPPGAGSEGGEVSLRAARLWLRLLGGDGGGTDGAAKQLFEEASRLRAPTQVIESTVLRALLALSSGDTDPAVELARRASRMAQAESLPQLEYLANLTLARVRRYSGRPHLALHILVALSRVAPPLWTGWIAWEIILAGGEPADLRPAHWAKRGSAPSEAAGLERAVAETPALAAARELDGFLRVVREGDRGSFARKAEELRAHAECWWDLAQESETLLAAVDGLRDRAPARLEPWRRGDTTNIPCGLHAIGIPRGADLETETATAFVLAGVGMKGRRVLRPGLALAPEARVLTRESAKNAAAGVRTETGIAALALAGPGGLSREDFFRIVYGFPFVPHRHQAVLDVLCHRMRNLLGDAGELRRDGGESNGAGAGSGGGGPSLALILNETIVVPDMRCALPTSDRVLRALATLGTTSASDAAESLRMPLRTVQAVLQQLVAEGACTVEREGRRVSYRIEDTTFTEVTSVSAQPRIA